MTGGSQTSAGVAVTTDKALSVDAMWSSVNLLASTVANLPVDVFNGSGTAKTPVVPMPPFVAMPSLIVTRRDWVYQAMVSLLLRGNAYGLVTAWKVDKPQNVEWLDPDTVKVTQRSSLREPTYKINGEDVAADQLIHLRAFLKPGSAVGMSPVAYRAETLGISLAAREYGAGFYSSGGHPTAVLSNPEATLTPEDAAKVKERYRATVANKREPLVVGKDWKYDAIQVSPQEADFVASMGYSDAQIARMYGPGLAEVLGYQTAGSSLTYSNRVDRSLDLLTYTVMPWINKFEDLLTSSVGLPNVVKFNTNALLRADNKARFDAYKIGIDSGFLSDDEARELEDRPPLVLSTQDALAKYAEPLGALVRAGFKPDAALVALGLDPIEHTGLVPITVASPKNPKIGGEQDVISA
jgi:HK97 family phage portal protein